VAKSSLSKKRKLHGDGVNIVQIAADMKDSKCYVSKGNAITVAKSFLCTKANYGEADADIVLALV